MPMVTSESSRKGFDLRSRLKSLRQASKTLLQVASKSLPDVSQAAATANLPQPPFPHLLRSNTPPTESEISVLRDVITIAEEEESRLKEMVSSHTGSDRLTSKTLKNLTSELGRTHQFIIEHNTILSSIRHIPPEVLQNIFIHTLPRTGSLGINDSPCISQLPWALSQVCQRWRTIMLSFSVIWMDLPAVDLGKAHTKKKPYLGLLAELLKRSHNTPIRFIVRGSNKDIGHPAIDMLVLHSDRWKEVKIGGQFGLLPAFKKIRGRLSSLQTLHLHLSTPSSSDSINYTAHDLFQIAPQLREVDYYGPPSELLFPTHQLVRYSQFGTYFKQAIQVMASSPTLKNLRCHFGDQIPSEIILPMAAFRFPDLTLLSTYFHADSTIFEPFFNNITTPALRGLIIKRYAENTLTPIRSMMLRSGSSCLLTLLHLQIPFAPGELQSILRLTPLVNNLKITFPPAQDISALLFNGSTSPLLPFLIECEFSLEDDDDFSPSTETIQAIKLLASSRCELPDNTTSAETLLSGKFHPLKTLRISFGWKSSLYRQYFEGWVESDMANELCKQHGRLLDMLPELILRRIPSNRKFDLKWKSKVTPLLTYLETLKIEKASDICMSGIQYILYAISIWFTKEDVRFPFSLIAKRILEKWEPILRDDMPNLRWLSTSLFLEHLPTTQNHTLCSSPDAMKFFYYRLYAYGLSDEHFIYIYGKIVNNYMWSPTFR